MEWISVSKKWRLPIGLESGEWDGLRSDYVLVVNENNDIFQSRSYSGTMDGSEYYEWVDKEDNIIVGVTHWMELPYLPNVK